MSELLESIFRFYFVSQLVLASAISHFHVKLPSIMCRQVLNFAVPFWFSNIKPLECARNRIRHFSLPDWGFVNARLKKKYL